MYTNQKDKFTLLRTRCTSPLITNTQLAWRIFSWGSVFYNPFYGTDPSPEDEAYAELHFGKIEALLFYTGTRKIAIPLKILSTFNHHNAGNISFYRHFWNIMKAASNK